MTDLHSHVLYGIDDGARTIDESIEILSEAAESGIKKIMLTPHFSIGNNVGEFVSLRNEKAEKLKKAAKEANIDIELKLGAEVYITDELFTEDKLELLLLGDSKVMLSEFKYHSLSREKFIGYIDEILKWGIQPIVAHPERYSYLWGDKLLLEAVIERDVLLQVNAVSLFEDSEEGDFARFLVDNNIAYAIGSDIHRPHSRRLYAMEKLLHSEDKGIKDMLTLNPNKIF